MQTRRIVQIVIPPILLLFSSSNVTLSMSISSPCSIPHPKSPKFSIYCQTAYHQLSYACDPTATISRTEFELIDKLLTDANFTSCLCDNDESSTIKNRSLCSDQGQFTISIVLIESIDINTIDNNCGYYSNRLDKSKGSIIEHALRSFGRSLANAWNDYCRVDLLLLIILTVGNDDDNEQTMMVPVLRFNLDLLNNNADISRPLPIDRDRLFSSMTDYIRSLSTAINQQLNQVNVTSSSKSNIPPWALLTGIVFVLLAMMAIAIACSTSAIGIGGGRQLSQISSSSNNVTSSTSIRMANQRWRAGFGAGLLHQHTASNSATLKGTMMFRSFNHNTRNNRLMRNNPKSAI